MIHLGLFSNLSVEVHLKVGGGRDLGGVFVEYEVVRQFNFFESSCFPPEKNAFDFFLSILCYVL